MYSQRGKVNIVIFDVAGSSYDEEHTGACASGEHGSGWVGTAPNIDTSPNSVGLHFLELETDPVEPEIED